MKETERQLESLEMSLRQPDSLSLHQGMSTVVEQEQRKERNPDYEEAEKQHYQSEEYLKLQLLKDRKKSLIE